MYCKNIAIFSHTIALGGSERVACLLADLLSEECYNVYLIIQKKVTFHIHSKIISLYTT